MNSITIMHEIAALAGYTIDAVTGQDPANKARALRRLNAVKSDIVSRYGAKWQNNYREGWLALGALYNTGTITVTQNSNTITGSGTAWTTTMKGYKIIIGSETYKIASVISNISLVITQPYQQVNNSSLSYTIWQDEYRLYPDVWSVGGFIDYKLPQRMTEAWPSNMKESYPASSTVEEPTVYTILHRQGLTTPYLTGTVSVSINSNVWTGVGTAWLANVEPGFEFTCNGVSYNVSRVNSDTELETYQLALTAISTMAYTTRGKNSIVVRFRKPTDQRVVHYWYYSKDYPFLNDNDEDWIVELFAEVIMNGAVRKDYLDKNDVARASLSKQEYEDSIRNMKVACEGAYTGIRTVGIYIPPEARE